MNLVIFLLFVMVLLVDAIVVVMPWLMPDSECFAVTVPHGERAKEPLKGLLREYAMFMAAVSALCLLAWPFALWVLKLDVSTEFGVGMLTLLMTLTMCLPLLVSFFLMLHYRRRVQDIKWEKGWRPEHVRSVAVVGTEDFPAPISVLWYLTYIPLIIAMVGFALLNYDRFPDTIPMNIDFNGTVTTTAPKSPVTLLFPAFVTAFVGVVFLASHMGIVYSKKPIDPDAPASSALAYGRFARTQSVMMLVTGIALSAVTGITFYASSLGTLPMLASVVIELAMVFLVVVPVLIISGRMGQSGGRIAESAPEGSMSRDDDSYWKLGAFYVNRDDPSIIVPKRFGVGWTLNLGNWASWVVIGVFVIFTTGFALGSVFMMR